MIVIVFGTWKLFDGHILYLNFAMALLRVLQRHYQVVSRLQTNTTPLQPIPVVVGTPCERTPVHDTRSDLGTSELWNGLAVPGSCMGASNRAGMVSDIGARQTANELSCYCCCKS